MKVLRDRFEAADRRITSWMARHSIVILRVSLGVTFLWFGVLKFFPGLSPAGELAARTMDVLSLGLVEPGTALAVLAVWETLIGLGLVSGWFLRATILLLVVQMLGTLTPLALFPSETFARFPYAPTLEGQYILKNAVLVAAALVVGSTVRGGRIVASAPPAGRGG